MNVPKAHANVKNIIISAIINGLYRFKSETDAVEFLNSLKDKFLLSKKYERFPNEVVLWIKDYKTEPGYKGNFTSLTVFKDKDSWQIKCKILPIDVKFHPQRELVKQKHPNWGHPILRAVKKKKAYESEEHANAELVQLQTEFPTVAIPAVNRLYLMIYEKAENHSGVKKYVLDVKPTEDGKFFLDYKLNTPKKAAPRKPASTASQPTIGKFTTQVLQKRKSKGKK